MRKTIRIAGAAAALMLWPALASAQSPAEQGFREGGRVGGPAGAVVGGAIGSAIELPGDVLGFVTGNPRPFQRVPDAVVIGQPVPPSVELYPVPRYRQYAYAYVNDQRISVDPRTRRVIRIVE